MKTIYFLILIVAFSVYACSNGIPQQDFKQTDKVSEAKSEEKIVSIDKDSNVVTETPKQEIKEKVPKDDIKNLDVVDSLKKSTLAYIEFVDTIAKDSNSLNANSYNLIGDYSNDKIDKKVLCDELDSNNKKIYDLNIKLNKEPNEGLLLSNELKKLRNSNLESQYANKAKQIKTFCEGDGSILSLTNLKNTFLDVSSPSYLTYDLKNFISTSKGTNSKLKYGIGDTIEKSGIKVTLNSITKNYAHFDCSYSYIDSGVFSDSEWKEISSYQSKINNRDSLSKQLISELNNKYSNKIDNRYKFLYVDFDFTVTDKELVKSKLPHHLRWVEDDVNRYGSDLYPLGFFGEIKHVYLHKLGNKDMLSEYPLRYLMRECPSSVSVLGGSLFDNNELGSFSSGEIKLIIDFSDCVNWDVANIEQTEKGLVCDNAYIFTIDMDKI